MAKAIDRLREKEGFAAQSTLPVWKHLPQPCKRHIIVRLAQWARTSEIQQEIKELFGLDVELQRIRLYDASKPQFCGGKALRALFHEARAAWLADYSNIGIAHQTERLRRLERLADKAEDQGAISMAASMIEQAAKEVGGSFTNRQEVRHSGGMSLVHLSAEDAKAELAQRLSQAVTAQLALPPAREKASAPSSTDAGDSEG